MSTNLALVTSQNFGNVPCDFYQNQNDEQQEFYMTRDQIGTALEYTLPNDSIRKIHERHSDRLDKFSVSVKLYGTDGKRYNTYVYNTKGVYEICRWSRQANADAFMDWVWEVIDGLRTGEYRFSQGNTTFTPQAVEAMIEKHLGSLRNDMNKYMTTMSNSFLHVVKMIEQDQNTVQKQEQKGINVTYIKPVVKPSIPILETNPKWKHEMYLIAKNISEQLPEQYEDYKSVLSAVYKKLRSVYGIVWEQEQKEFKNKYDIVGNVKFFDIIYNKEQLKSLFENLLFDMADNIKKPEKVAQKSILEPVFIELDPIKAVIAPLIQKRQDKTVGGTNTYREVYNRMGVCWSNRLSRYKNSHGLKKNPKKSVVIKENEKLFNLYQKVIAEMLNE